MHLTAHLENCADYVQSFFLKSQVICDITHRPNQWSVSVVVFDFHAEM